MLKLTPISDSERFAGMFGCVEMEEAALQIYKELLRQGNPKGELSYWDFRIDEKDLEPEDDGDNSKGLFMLAVYGWIEDIETNGKFIMSKDFIRRINKRLKYPAEQRILCD